MSTTGHFLFFSLELDEGISLVEFAVWLIFAPSDLRNPNPQKNCSTIKKKEKLCSSVF